MAEQIKELKRINHNLDLAREESDTSIENLNIAIAWRDADIVRHLKTIKSAAIPTSRPSQPIKSAMPVSRKAKNQNHSKNPQAPIRQTNAYRVPPNSKGKSPKVVTEILQNPLRPISAKTIALPKITEQEFSDFLNGKKAIDETPAANLRTLGPIKSILKRPTSKLSNDGVHVTDSKNGKTVKHGAVEKAIPQTKSFSKSKGNLKNSNATNTQFSNSVTNRPARRNVVFAKNNFVNNRNFNICNDGLNACGTRNLYSHANRSRCVYLNGPIARPENAYTNYGMNALSNSFHNRSYYHNKDYRNVCPTYSYALHPSTTRYNYIPPDSLTTKPALPVVKKLNMQWVPKSK